MREGEESSGEAEGLEWQAVLGLQGTRKEAQAQRARFSRKAPDTTRALGGEE